MWLAASARALAPAPSSTAGLPPAVTPVFLGLFVSLIFIAQHLRVHFVFRKLGELFVDPSQIHSIEPLIWLA
jgi:hypothetical protein